MRDQQHRFGRTGDGEGSAGDMVFGNDERAIARARVEDEEAPVRSGPRVERQANQFSPPTRTLYEYPGTVWGSRNQVEEL